MEGSGARPIVVGIDGSFSAERAARWAAREARLRGVPLQLLHAYEFAADFAPDSERGSRSVFLGYGRDCLNQAAEQARGAAPGVEVSTELVVAQSVDLLAGRSKSASLVVVGSRGLGGVGGLLLGSVAVGLVSHAHCPVVIVRGDEYDRPADEAAADPSAPVVVGIDGSEVSSAALAYAYEWASVHDAPLVAVHAWAVGSVDPSVAPLVDTEAMRGDAERLAAESLAGWREKYPDVEVRRVVVPERPAQALLEESGHARLLVVGARGRGGMSGLLLGSTSQALIHRATCPVAVVRPAADHS
ncbi:MAG TPA: universal stress protein [Pseudonocardia sp.]|jgi:nucleotide-binding universal stress UspA family protein|nr:universal stress protein [Pseudonocardia sp.]